MTDLETLKRLRRCVLIHGILYHIYDSPVVTDAQYDAMVKELNDFPLPQNTKLPLNKEFQTWDGKSGFIMVHTVDKKWCGIALSVKRNIDNYLKRAAA